MSKIGKCLSKSGDRRRHIGCKCRTLFASIMANGKLKYDKSEQPRLPYSPLITIMCSIEHCVTNYEVINAFGIGYILVHTGSLECISQFANEKLELILTSLFR